ncbi:granzyme A-like [Tenrec ecaudatus]|uniref:granzyme A-like n=1 Tax=Tenrec ecaudatus TaxID=94439 RepID=UPI003F5A7160
MITFLVFSEEIIGGHDVKPHSRPFMALLQGQTRCAGALIKDNWVLTAAHCKKKAQVILGAHSATKKESQKQVFSIKNHIVYPCYDKQSYEGDLQLLQLNGSAKIKDKTVSILKLPQNAGDVKPNTKCHVAGWGITGKRQRKPSDTLMEANVTVIDRKICNDAGHYNFQPVIDNNMICAGLKGEGDSCKGDSGSPLICGNVFKGVTSFGDCGNPRKPGIYTLLTTKYLNWIKKSIGVDM